ncbi:Transcription factor RF2b [Morus notabilis]|uniref:Transcription factor RF2b n=1 Tax=Morus notabilis TaxID=981085 RepID=W9RFD2_9ROSA|nr:basic leucine zipper 34 [Morus notabilis]EXB75015.1 Transcription factor RF2b [Morus notabilis]
MAELPPKIPNMTQNWSNAFLPHQRMDTFITTTAQQQQQQHHHHQHQQPCWVDEFLDFASARRGAHRRSVSDSIAFLESPVVIMEDQDQEQEGRRHHNNNNNNNIMHGFERLDDEQLIMSMFSDDMSLSAAAGAVAGEGAPPAVSSSNPSTPSDQNSNNDGIKPTMALHQPHDQQPKTEPGEVESPCEGDPHAPPPPQPLSTDSIIDPKRVKRILANRQSAQRSRVRKLQYISELEHSVTALQSEVSALSPRVAFLDHQRLILNVDNSALKQRIAALAQDKIFKDAHQEALKKEIERLRQVYHQQNLKKKNMQQQQQEGINQNSHPPPPSTDQQNSDIALATTCTGKEQISIHS